MTRRPPRSPLFPSPPLSRSRLELDRVSRTRRPPRGDGHGGTERARRHRQRVWSHLERAPIGPDGGTLQVGPHTLSVPAGALGAPVTITAGGPAGAGNPIQFQPRSGERRGGKEGRSRGAPCHLKKKQKW